MKVLPALIRKYTWESTLGFIFMWFSLMLGVIPISVAQGHRFVPESWFMTVEKLDVTSGFTHTVYFTREVSENFKASWSVEIESVSGEVVCVGGSIIGYPSSYTKTEKQTKIFTLKDFVGASCTLPYQGAYHLNVCWFIDFGIWTKPICRTVDFYHYNMNYNMKRTNNE